MHSIALRDWIKHTANHSAGNQLDTVNMVLGWCLEHVWTSLNTKWVRVKTLFYELFEISSLNYLQMFPVVCSPFPIPHSI